MGPPEDLSDQELAAMCHTALKEADETQKHLTTFKHYSQKREVRFLVLGDPSVFTETLSKYNELQGNCNRVRLEVRKRKEEADRAEEIAKRKREEEERLHREQQQKE